MATPTERSHSASGGGCGCCGCLILIAGVAAIVIGPATFAAGLGDMVHEFVSHAEGNNQPAHSQVAPMPSSSTRITTPSGQTVRVVIPDRQLG